MARLDHVAGYAVFSALQFIALLPIIFYWIRSLKRVAPIQSQPLRISVLFLRISAPVYALGVLINGSLGAYLANGLANNSRQLARSDADLYLNLVAGFLITAGDIGITLALYLAVIASAYVALGNTTWWKLLRLDAPVGGALLLVLDIAFFGRSVALTAGADSTRLDNNLLWLPLIIDLTLLIVTLGAFGSLIYTRTKIKKRGEIYVAAMGKIPTLLLVASVLWIVRCSYNVATTIKSMLPDWTRDELDAQLILIPIFEVLIGAAVLALVTIVVLKPVWGDASLHPTTSQPAPISMGQYPQQQYPQQPEYVQQPQYAQQPAQYGYAQPPPQAAPYYTEAPQNQQQPHVYDK